MKKPIIGFCGLTHLGICSSIATIAKGFKVICYDDDHKVIQDLNHDVLPIIEPDINNTLFKHKHLIEFTNNITKIKSCDIIYISIDVKTSPNGTSDLHPIRKLIEKILKTLNQSKILVILSQVPPGFTREFSKCNHSIFYQVETLIFGKALERALYPERIIVGNDNKNKILPKKYFNFLACFNCPIIRMNYESAELTKISINLLLISTLSLTNKMAEICENIDAVWHDIIPALQLDKRIGPYAYISPGLGISGGNLERDLKTIELLTDKKDIDNKLFKIFKDINDKQKNWVWEKLKVLLNDKVKKRIGILGLTYKENTHSLKNAPSIALLPMLENHDVIVYDPVANVEGIFNWCKHAKNCLEVISGSDIIIIMTPWDEFKQLSLESISRNMKGNVILDPFNIFKKTEIKKHNLVSFVIGSK